MLRELVSSRALNSAWRTLVRAEGRRFRRALRSPAIEQELRLGEALSAATGTAFGGHHALRSGMSYADFAARVPLGDHASHRPWIERIAAGEAGVLTNEAVLLLEPTSGSTAGRKLIPYTSGLRAQMRRAVDAWVWDLFCGIPGAMAGSAFWSISPVIGDETTAGGVRIGFDDDTEYLGRFTRSMATRLLAVPAEVARCADANAFRRRTLAHLVCRPDLALVSVWNPTFLLRLLDQLDSPEPLLRTAAEIDPVRSAEVERIVAVDADRAAQVERLFPRLALISCWADAGAAVPAAQVGALFPDAILQPKGLLSTEAFVSIPVVGRDGGVLAVRSHFFEFLSEGDVERGVIGTHAPCRRASELEIGSHYVPVVTTAGGLYRYVTGDVVEIVGRAGATPMLRLVGRWDATVDLVGEKLDESHVRQVARDAFGALDVDATVLGVPRQGDRPRYVFLVGTRRPLTATERVGAEQRFRLGLRDNPYYRHARDVDQLGDEHVVFLTPGEPAWQRYERACVERGQRLGDVKPTSLCRRFDVADLVITQLEAPAA